MPAACRSADGLAQFVRAVLQVRGLGREERQRVVAPVVAQAAFQQVAVLQEGVHRQQLDRGDAQALQVLDEARVGQRRGGAAQRLAQVLALHRDAAQVGLVDDAVGPGGARRLAVAPVEWQVLDHHGLGHGRRAVAPVQGQVGAGVVQAVAEQRIAPVDRTGELAGVGVQQQLVRVEAVAVASARRGRARASRRPARAARRAGSRARSRRCIPAGRSGAVPCGRGRRTGRARRGWHGPRTPRNSRPGRRRWRPGVRLASRHAGQQRRIHGHSPWRRK